MATSIAFAPAIKKPATPVSAILAAAGRSLLHCYDRYIQRRWLASLDHRMLDDIGVTPAAARCEAGMAAWR
jgi:uncharacterized protein YjiS (DUF1127 family)